MVPDRGFVKQLKKLDPDYEVFWDWGVEKWEIWKVSGEMASHVATIQTKDRSYRELGADVLLRLQAGDTTRFTRQELFDYFDEMDNQIQRRKRRDLLNKLEAIAKDTYNMTHGILQIQVPQRYKIGRVING